MKNIQIYLIYLFPRESLHLCTTPYLLCSSFSSFSLCLPSPLLQSPLPLFTIPSVLLISPPPSPCCTLLKVCPPLSISASLSLPFCLLFHSYQRASLTPFLLAPYTPFSISNAASCSAYIWSHCWAIFKNSWHVSSPGQASSGWMLSPLRIQQHKLHCVLTQPMHIVLFKGTRCALLNWY